MIATKRERNENFIAWLLVEELDGKGRFTPCRPTESDRLTLGDEDWLHEMPKQSLPPITNPVDNDISCGRIKRFSSMDELIKDLDQTE